jgi:hypothetical protein
MIENSQSQSVAGTNFPRWREFFLFSICSIACMTFVFGSAIWNHSILAPLDIPSALYSKYHWLDENQGGIPKNHYVVDIFDHELPRQYSIYRALQSGEFPWWDPYTDYGRPLAAEAHTSGTDAVRLVLYHFLSFVPAYNATKLLHSFLLGLGTFLLLRHFGHRLWLSIAVALAVQFAGGHTLFQTPLCVSACATWYPWIWLAWSHSTRYRQMRWLVAAALFCALSIMAGNQQTHAFLPLFGVCFIAGIWLKNRDSGKSAAKVVVSSGILGALLALPILIPQMELYFLCQRVPAFADFKKIQLLTGVANLAGFFPWSLGTFRTIDLSKLFSQGGLGFCVYIGCAGLVLATVGAAKVFNRTRCSAEGYTAILLAIAYFIICSTPLVAIFYTRIAVIVTLGLGILAVEGTEILLSTAISKGQRRLIIFLTSGILIAFIACNFVAFFVYPHFEKRLESVFLEKQNQNHSFDSAPALREFQIKNLPHEISLENIETVFGAVSAASLLIALFVRQTHLRAMWLGIALAVNLFPELSFAGRFTVKSSVDDWQNLLAGGPEQRFVIAALDSNLRLCEEAPGRFDFLFPGATAELYQVHVNHGYSSFPLPDLATLPNQKISDMTMCDASYISLERGQSAGQFTTFFSNETSARFHWEGNSNRKIKIVSEMLNTIILEVEAGKPDVLWRTDRYYPGWKLVSPRLETHLAEGFFTVNVPAERQQLIFQYRPRYLNFSIFVSLGTMALCLGVLFWKQK